MTMIAPAAAAPPTFRWLPLRLAPTPLRMANGLRLRLAISPTTALIVVYCARTRDAGYGMQITINLTLTLLRLIQYSLMLTYRLVVYSLTSSSNNFFRFNLFNYAPLVVHLAHAFSLALRSHRRLTAPPPP